MRRFLPVAVFCSLLCSLGSVVGQPIKMVQYMGNMLQIRQGDLTGTVMLDTLPQRIFTHHDSFIHIHYHLYTRYHAGHLDEVAFDQGEPVRLLLPGK